MMMFPEVIEDLILDFSASMEEFERRQRINTQITYQLVLCELECAQVSAHHHGHFCVLFCLQILAQFTWEY